MTPRAPIISQEDPVEDSRKRDTVEHKNQHQLKHRYPTRITQLSKDPNQVERSATTTTRHQNWLMNIHEQVNDTPQVIDKCLKENASIPLITITQNDYITQMANTIIVDDTGKELSYCQLRKNLNNQNIWNISFDNELGRLDQGEGGQIEGTYTMFFIEKYKVPIDQLKDVSYGRIIVDYRQQKEEPHRTILTMGGNVITYAGYVSTLP